MNKKELIDLAEEYLDEIQDMNDIEEINKYINDFKRRPDLSKNEKRRVLGLSLRNLRTQATNGGRISNRSEDDIDE